MKKSAIFSISSAVAIAVIALLFLIANRGAYQGFFTDDDFDNMANAHGSHLADFTDALIKPVAGGAVAFRPAAHAFYYVLVRTAGVSFTPYVAGIHWIHILNLILIFALARSLGATPIGAGAAAMLFAFHAGVLAIYWRPMYIFDLLCGTFCLLTLLCYVRGRLLLSVLFFWLALKSKEIAILLPLVLAAYELAFQKRRWKRLIPFFAISAILGVQALVFNVHRNNDYSLRFAPAAIWTCIRFYASKLAIAPAWIGIAMIAALLLIPNRIARFGATAFLLLLLPMLALPGRLFGAYLYVPLIGLAIGISACARPIPLAIFFGLWIPWNYLQLRIDRRAELASAAERRAWFQPVAAFVRDHPETDTFIYDQEPKSLEPYGIAGAVRVLRPPFSATTVVAADSPDRIRASAAPHLAVLVWDEPLQTLHVLPRTPDQAYVRLSEIAPIWQLGEGWIDSGAGYRWIAPHASARLYRPPGAKIFDVVVFVPEVYLRELHEGRLTVSLNRQPIGVATLDKPNPTTFHFHLAAAPSATVEVEFDVAPALKDPNGSPKFYGAPIAAFGFTQF